MDKFINADDLEKRIDEEFCKPCRDAKQDYNGVLCRACKVDDMLILIDSEPTADVREVNHCHIVHDKGGWLSCSNCHILLPQLFDVYRFYYCPNCGAIMDE